MSNGWAGKTQIYQGMQSARSWSGGAAHPCTVNAESEKDGEPRNQVPEEGLSKIPDIFHNFITL